MLQTQKFREYAEKQCLKIAHYLQKVRSIEILRMDATFLRDEYDNVWFSHVKNIKTRKCNKHKSLAEMLDLKQGNQQLN